MVQFLYLFGRKNCASKGKNVVISELSRSCSHEAIKLKTISLERKRFFIYIFLEQKKLSWLIVGLDIIL
jgi:hypothetical protein